MERDSRQVGKARPGGGHAAGSPAPSLAKKGSLQLAPERTAAAKGLQCGGTGGRRPSTQGAAPAAGRRREPLGPRLRKSVWCKESPVTRSSEVEEKRGKKD